MNEETYLLKLQCAGATFSNMCDRFVSEGYKKEEPIRTLEQQLEIYATIGGMSAVPYVYYEHPIDPITYRDLLKTYGFRVGTIAPDNYTKSRWKYGTFAARDAQTRRDIVQLGKESMDFAAAAEAIDIMFWMAHDGYNYPFQDNYEVHWEYMVECIQEIASYRSDVQVTLEYKSYEPLTHQYVSDVGKVLLMCEKVGLPNVGVIVDYGHALLAHENPAESVALVNAYNRLSMIHLNDNYGRFDDDLIFGTVSLWQALEFFWKLDEIGYDGWYIMDNWPARMDGVKATREFVKMANTLMRLAQKLPKERIRELQAEDGNAPDMYALLREYVLQ